MKKLGIVVFILTVLFALSGCNTGEGSSSSVSSGGVEADSAGQRAEAVVRSILTCPNEFLKENIQRMTVVVDAAGEGAVEGQSEAEAAQEEYEEFLKGLYAQEDFTEECYAKLLEQRFFTSEFGTPCAKKEISLIPETVTAQLTEEADRVYSVTAQGKIQKDGSEEALFTLEGKVQMDESGKISSIRFPEAMELQEQLRNYQ